MKRKRYKRIEYEFFPTFYRLEPTSSQKIHIIDHCDLVSRVHLWAHERIFVPGHMRQIERTHSFCTRTLMAAVKTKENDTLSNSDKEAISNIGYDGFINLFKMAAYEHARVPFGKERKNKWILLNEENKVLTFLNASEMGWVVNDDGIFLNTKEFGLLKINPKYKNRFNENFVANTSEKIFIYPQLLFDKIAQDCYVRFVVACHNASWADNDIIVYERCPYISNPDWFFTEYGGYLSWPIFK